MDMAGYKRGSKRYIIIALLVALAGLLITTAPVAAAPSISLSPAAGAQGTMVTISGTMFDSYKGDKLYIFFKGEQIVGSPVTVPDSGKFNISFGVPAGMAAGVYTVQVKLTPEATSLIAGAVFTVETTTLSIDIPSGPVGTSITLTGTGFFSNSPVWIYYHNPIALQIGTVTSSPTGRFTYSYTIPDSTAGVHTISVTNATSNYAETSFTVKPGISLSADSGGPGELISISGKGFGFRSNVNISIGATSVTTARTDDLGSFNLSFNVPDIKPNPYEVKAQDQAGNVDTEKFTVTAGVRLSTATGGVGSSLTVTGSGFKAGGTVTIDFDAWRAATLTADNEGGFYASFIVPAVGAGTHVVRVSDGTTVRELIYTIEAVPPPVPQPMLPLDDTETRARASFAWAAVADESLPVTYDLQIAGDINFAAIIIEKTELSATTYTLNEEEVLEATAEGVTYYWRVRAIDGAGTVGAWSETCHFLVKAPAAPQLVPAATPNEVGERFIELDEDGTFTLEWSDVTSLAAPVLYTLEIAGDPEFTVPLVTKTGLTESSYTLTAEEMALLQKNTQYYWRVKATDSDGADGEWSEATSFIYGSTFRWPAWATWMLVGIAVVVIAGAAYYMGQRKGKEEILE